jgi:hypothetical protein
MIDDALDAGALQFEHEDLAALDGYPLGVFADLQLHFDSENRKAFASKSLPDLNF